MQATSGGVKPPATDAQPAAQHTLASTHTVKDFALFITSSGMVQEHLAHDLGQQLAPQGVRFNSVLLTALGASSAAAVRHMPKDASSAVRGQTVVGGGAWVLTAAVAVRHPALCTAP